MTEDRKIISLTRKSFLKMMFVFFFPLIQPGKIA